MEAGLPARGNASALFFNPSTFLPMNTTTQVQPNPARARDYFAAKMEFTTGPVELERELREGDVVIVDVRAAEDYEKAHVPGAISLPEDRWERPEGLDRQRVNVLYCYSQVCHLAARAAVELSSQGYPVRELEGGFKAWQKHDLPVEGAKQTEAAKGARKKKPAAVPPPNPADRSPKQENL
jgi:rhodanese-related sulfurtransferase